MGQELSNRIDDSVPTQTLDERSLAAVATLIRDGRAKRIVVLAGAGISTAAGIPDFRSPDTGLYANLERLHLPYAEAVFSIDYFRQDPKPFYVLARELYPGQFYPTVSHAFLVLLHQKGLLEMLFTQNIDCLERAAGVPADRIVEAHGSFATQRCIDCKTPYTDAAAMREHVQAGRVPHCPEPGCGGLVKPDIVFFGESLPPRFNEMRDIPSTVADLVLVLGTSLSVYPFAALATMAASGVPRVLLNREQVGDLGTRPDDVLALGSCDEGVRKLADALGWRDELEALWTSVVGDAEAERQRKQDVLLARPMLSAGDESSEDGEGDESQPDDGADDTEACGGNETDDKADIDKPKSSAEAEVNAIAASIEASLRLVETPNPGQNAFSEHAATATTSRPPQPALPPQSLETADREKPAVEEVALTRNDSDTTPTEKPDKV